MIQKISFFSILFLCFSLGMKAQNNVGVNTTTPHSSAVLDVSATDKGMLVPRMTAAQKTAIATPATGLLVFQTDGTSGFYYFNGTTWIALSGGVAGATDSSQLQKITENGNIGWRILGRDTANYGNIGSEAIDLSFSSSASTTRGATGENSTAMGSNTTVSGNFSTAMGSNTTASGNYSTAMGIITTASGVFSTAMGVGTSASGSSSTAIGDGTTASGSSSTSMGSNTKASGHSSTAMGLSSRASGSNTASMGAYTIAKSYGELAVGYYNDTLAFVNSNTWGGDTNRVFTVGTGSNNFARKTAFVIQQDGRVGIGTGTTAVTKGLVQIDGFVDYQPFQQTGYLNVSGATGSFTNNSNTEYSIWASHRIAANEFNAYSDKRIKNVIGISSNISDLNTLAQIRITDYTMKDKVQYGDKAFKKVIAQELKEVYPQAVNISSNIIPSIYQKATISNGWIALETDLVKGDIVKIVTANSNKEVTVDEVEKGRFKVALSDGDVFVYGKQVNDFHTVDYEALTTLNVSATQALLKRIEELEAQNSNLIIQVKEVASLKNDIEMIKAQLNIGAASASK